MKYQFLFTILTACIAVYGAVLSTINLIRETHKNKRRISIKVSRGFLTYANNQLSDDMLIINISNPGNRSVTINTPFFLLPDGYKLISFNPDTNVKLPYELTEGKNAIIWFNYKELIAEFKRRGFKNKIKLKPFVTDQTGKDFQGKEFTLSLK